MAKDDVKVTRPDGTEVTVTKRAYEGIYQYRAGWKRVDEKNQANTKKASKKGSDS